jgi:diguanylate cyclase (GGDEF)-like protein
VALLMIDLDHFKPINDRYGHPVGDVVLRTLAERFAHAVRPTDGVARVGGDEFAIVLVGVRDVRHAQRVADKLIELACQPMQVGEHTMAVGASVGVAIAQARDSGWGDLVHRADALLYRAKKSGRGRRATDESESAAVA